MYWHLNKETGKASVFRSTYAIAKNTVIKIDTLKYHFTRKQREEYETKQFRIVKVKLIK